MEHSNRYDGLDPCAVKFIRYHARRLARRRTVPDMEVEDYEPDLVADLLARSPRFDPRRATYPTFADRVIRHRIATLIKAGVGPARVVEASPLAESVEGEAGTEALWPASMLPAEDRAALRVDLERFVQRLPIRLRRCCAWLATENRRAAAAALGLHRSALYDAARDLKRCATGADLHLYIGSGTSPTHPEPAR